MDPFPITFITKLWKMTYLLTFWYYFFLSIHTYDQDVYSNEFSESSAHHLWDRKPRTHFDQCHIATWANFSLSQLKSERKWLCTLIFTGSEEKLCNIFGVQNPVYIFSMQTWDVVFYWSITKKDNKTRKINFQLQRERSFFLSNMQIQIFDR